MASDEFDGALISELGIKRYMNGRRPALFQHWFFLKEVLSYKRTGRNAISVAMGLLIVRSESRSPGEKL